MLEIGAEAPAFSVQDHRSETVRLCDIDRSVGMAYGAADAAEAGYAKVDPNTHLDEVLGDLTGS